MGHSQIHIYTHYGVDEGLPSSEVYDIYQDKQGYIWLATDKGLTRFNGYEFENYTTQDGLPGNTILNFYPQANGQIWCYEFHSQGLFYFNDIFDGFKTPKFNSSLKKEFRSGTVIKSVFLDKNETLFVGGFRLNGFIRITKNGIINKQFDLLSYRKPSDVFEGVNVGLKDNRFFMVSHNYKSDDEFYFMNTISGTSSRLNFIFLDKKNTIFIDKKLGHISHKKEVRYYKTEQNPIGIKRIDDDLFFVGYYKNGAEIRDVSGNVVDSFLPNKSVSNFLIDAEGSYWFTTLDDGVFYIENPNVKVTTEDHISSIVKDDNNTLYLGFENGNIGRLSKNTIETLYYGLSNNAALVEFDNDHNTIYGYADGSLKDYTYKNKSFDVTANKLPEHIQDGTLASVTSMLYTLKNDSVHAYTSEYKVQDICNFKDTTLIATSSGLLIKDGDSVKKHQPLDILKSRIDDIDLNKTTHTVYMATQGHGVVVYGDSIYNITKMNGLTNDIISEVHIENDSTVWACSNSGLNRISFKPNNTYDIVTITKDDGLLSNDIDDVEIINDTVWVATKKGLCYFSKHVLSEKLTSKKISSLSLKRVLVNNTEINDHDTTLKYNQNNLEFQLQAISQKNTKDINYLYRLKELDSAWAITTNRSITFPTLSPGKYTFQAKASVLGNKDDELINFAFTIRPPFWKSWWFYSLCGLFVGGLVYTFFKIRVLTYNKDITRELIRLIIKRLKRKELFYKFRSNGEDFKIPTHQIQYINSQGNYLDIITNKRVFTIRCKIADFISTTPDNLEYLRVHRSYIIRIDQITSKGKNWVAIKDQKIPVGETYLHQLENIVF